MMRHDPCEGMPVSRTEALRSGFEGIVFKSIMFDIIVCEAVHHVFD